MWSKEDVTKFIEDHKIQTDGALATHHVEVSEKESGDEWVEVTLDYWPHNSRVVIDVLQFCMDAKLLSRDSTMIYFHLFPNKVTVQFYTHWCDPD